MKIQLYKAFTSKLEEGNPAGVIFDADELSQERMIEIARELGFSESVFIVKPTSPDADVRFRFMTSTIEVDACGHATLAGSQAIYDVKPFEKLRIETNAGVVIVEKSEGKLMMRMTKAEIGDEEYSKSEIASLLNIPESEILELPLKTASVGSPKLMIPIKSLQTVQNIKANFEKMIEFCKNNPVKGFYPFTEQTLREEADFHARQFNPAAGIPEDPITGIAGGALGLYVQKFINPQKSEIIVEQGSEMRKPGQIFVEIKNGAVYVGGNAVKYH